jgi:hypothetical protein
MSRGVRPVFRLSFLEFCRSRRARTRVFWCIFLPLARALNDGRSSRVGMGGYPVVLHHSGEVIPVLLCEIVLTPFGRVGKQTGRIVHRTESVQGRTCCGGMRTRQASVFVIQRAKLFASTWTPSE